MSAFGTPTATPLIFSLAGAGAGITEAILVNPFEVVKVSLQSDRSKLKVIFLRKMKIWFTLDFVIKDLFSFIRNSRVLGQLQDKSRELRV